MGILGELIVGHGLFSLRGPSARGRRPPGWKGQSHGLRSLLSHVSVNGVTADGRRQGFDETRLVFAAGESYSAHAGVAGHR